MDKEALSEQASISKFKTVFNKAVLALLLLFVSVIANADVVPPKPTNTDSTIKKSGFNNVNQTLGQPPEMATGMRSNGKIFVVVAVMTMILIGLFIYLFSLDKKISKLEKNEYT